MSTAATRSDSTPECLRSDVWTPAQLKFLRDNVGVSGWSVLCRRTGNRSRDAVQKQVRRSFGGGGITRGTYQLAEAIRETGYSRSQFRRAAGALNQRWLRTGKGGAYLITGEQLEDMVCWLGHDYWSKKLELYCCVQCGTSSRPHHTFGLCLPCHRKLKRRAENASVPWTARGLLEWVGGIQDRDFVFQRVVVNLEAGRAPSLDDLRHLCSLSRQ